MNAPRFGSTVAKLLLAGMCAAELFSLSGCVVYTEPAPVRRVAVVSPAPVVSVYGTPAGYYYREHPVYVYNNRRVYYANGYRYYYGGYHPYHYRGGYRYYY